MLKAVATCALVALAAVPAALAGPGLRIGVVEDAPIWSSNPGADLDLAKLAGFDTIRMTAQWQPGMTAMPGQQMGRVQRAAMAATSRGIQPIVSIYNAGGTMTPSDPASRAQFVEFATNVVRQLPWVSTFVVGNEPNSTLYWQPQFDASGGDAAATAYEQLLAASYDAIKAARPNATVIGGALDSRGADDPTSKRLTHSPTAFIHDLGAAYRASGRTKPIMDVFDEHVYADNATLPPSMPHVGTGIATADYGKLVALLGKAFDGTAQKGSTLPIIYGEFGVESTTPAAKAGLYSGTSAAPTVDEATQAAYYIQALKLALCQPNVIGLMNFHVVDETNLAGWQSGPFYADGTPKSSFPAIRDAIAAAHAGTLTKCPDQNDPTVALQVANGTVTAAAADDVGVGEVQLFVDGKLAGVDYRAPYTFAWKPGTGGHVVQARALDGAGNVGTAMVSVGVRTLSGARGMLFGGPGGTFAWKAPKDGTVTFKAPGLVRRINARRGVVYRITAHALPLSWQS
ncbi:MAG: Ig-like domain-containing protein [Actinomycetota bacterium]